MDQPGSGQNPVNEAELRAELARVTQKLQATSDTDIKVALERRISELKQLLSERSSTQLQENIEGLQGQISDNISTMRESHYESKRFEDASAQVSSDLNTLQGHLTAQAETVRPKLTSREEEELRAELRKVSAQRYSVEDPEARAQLQARVAELQGILGIDVSKLAGSEMSSNAVPDLSVAAKPVKSKAKDAEKAKAKTNLAELQALVAEQSAKIRKTEINTDLDIPETTEAPTSEQLAAAEKLIQQARVEKMRGNKPLAKDLLEQAARAAPSSPMVLELLGDEYSERKQLGRALAYYRRAAKVDPKNVNLERKVAMTALGVDASSASSSFGSLDDSAVPMASKRAAMLISLFLPGVGHLVLGQKAKGIAILVTWCVCLAWVILMGRDVAKLGAMIAGGQEKPNLIVALPMLIMVVTYIATLSSFKGTEEVARKPVDRPRPPVNLPFE